MISVTIANLLEGNDPPDIKAFYEARFKAAVGIAERAGLNVSPVTIEDGYQTARALGSPDKVAGFLDALSQREITGYLVSCPTEKDYKDLKKQLDEEVASQFLINLIKLENPISVLAPHALNSMLYLFLKSAQIDGVETEYLKDEWEGFLLPDLVQVIDAGSPDKDEAFWMVVEALRRGTFIDYNRPDGFRPFANQLREHLKDLGYEGLIPFFHEAIEKALTMGPE